MRKRHLLSHTHEVAGWHYRCRWPLHRGAAHVCRPSLLVVRAGHLFSPCAYVVPLLLSLPPTSFSALACATRPTHSQEGSAMGYHMHLPRSDQPPPRTRAGAHALAGSMRLRPVGSRRGYDCCCGRERRRYGKTYSPPAMGENELVHYTRAFAGRLWSMCRRYDPSYLWCWTVCMVPLEIVKEITKLNKCIWLFEEVLTLMSCGRIVFFLTNFNYWDSIF